MTSTTKIRSPIWRSCLLGASLLLLLGVFLPSLLLRWLWTSGPWVERFEVSPDGRYVAFNEGRTIGLDLETRATIAQADDQETRKVIRPWGDSIVAGIEWTGPRELRVAIGAHGSSSTMEWRDVRVTIEYLGDWP